MSAGDWLHLVVLLQLPGAAVGWLTARSVYRRRPPAGGEISPRQCASPMTDAKFVGGRRPGIVPERVPPPPPPPAVVNGEIMEFIRARLDEDEHIARGLAAVWAGHPDYLEEWSP